MVGGGLLPVVMIGVLFETPSLPPSTSPPPLLPLPLERSFTGKVGLKSNNWMVVICSLTAKGDYFWRWDGNRSKDRNEARGREHL